MVDILIADGMKKLLTELEAGLSALGSSAGFDAAGWLTHWLHEPLPALGGAKPIDLMQTPNGQAMVSQVLAQVFSGAYA